MAVNGAVSAETEEALVVWINSFPLESEVQALKQLNDGQVLWQMLHAIDEDTFRGKLPNDKQTDFSRRQNLQFVQDRVQDYLQDVGKSHNALSEQELETMAVAESAPAITKFLKLILTAMLESPTMTEHVQKVMTLPPSTQEIVGGFMQEVADLGSDLDATDNEEDEPAPEPTTPRGAPPGDFRMDQILQLEQQYAKIMSQLERRNQEFRDLEAEMEAVSKSLERSQEKNEALNQQITERDEQLKKARWMMSDREQSSMKELETKISQQEESLSSKDNQMSRHQSDIAELQREKRRLLVSDEKLQKLQDEFDVMKAELERQTRKANTADKYVQKLQASQSVEKERDSLRQELDDARNQLGTLNKLRQENAALSKANDEASRTLSQIEQEHEELRMTKKQIRIDNDSLVRQVDALNERFAQDQETIAELRDRGGGSDAMSSPTVVNGGLEGELHETSKNEDQMKSNAAELIRQNNQLVSDASDKDAKITTLQRQLSIAMESAGDYTGQISGLREEVLTLRSSLTEIREGHPVEATATFQKMRDQLKAAEQRQADLTKEIDNMRSNGVPIKSDSNEKSENTEAAEAERTEQEKRIQDQASKIQDLERSLEEAKSSREKERTKAEQNPPQEDSRRVYVENLERELKLMASAYHDLASRLQMNTVVLQRRADNPNPRSWLGRQRRAVEGPTGIIR